MKLEKARITNFRCIDDSEPFSIGQVTCLVGKNESGKTAILHALTKVNSVDPALAKFDKDKDYPRKILTDYSDETPVLETSWEVDHEDVAAVEKVIGQGNLVSKRITIRRNYKNYEPWDIDINEKGAVEWAVTQAGCDAEERKNFTNCSTVPEVLAKAQPLKASSPRIANLLERIAMWRDNRPALAALDVLNKRIPKFLYFASYDRMDGNVSLEHLRQSITSKTVSRNDTVFLAFLDFAATPMEELEKANKYEALKARVEAASIKISRQIFKYWSQNRHLKVQFSLETGRPGDPAPFNSGNIMRTRILNMLHDMTVPFDDRSAGFVWFFSFLVLFSQVKKKHGNVIILLDEPGLNLHAKAQSDLLRFINDELRPHHQVIYTTHSPFMVPSDDLTSVRTVEDVVAYNTDGTVADVLGTKVGDQILSTDKDTLFPLQGALGYELTQSLFIGKHNLVVEGPSDILYTLAASTELGRQGRVKKDSRWTLCPAGGIDKVAAFLTLFGGNKLHVAVLADYAQGQKSKVEWLKKSRLLADGHILTTIDFCKQPEADIEDFFGPELYVELVNDAYGLQGKDRLTVADVNGATEKSPRIVKKVEAVWRLRPSLPEFDHYAPAMWLLQNPAWLTKGDTNRAACLTRFEDFFKKVNSLLPAA